MSEDQLILLQAGEMVVKYQPPIEPDGSLSVLIHGLTGDENSMWVFSKQLPGRSILVAPRAPHAVSSGGYSWVQESGFGYPGFDQFLPSVELLHDAIDHLDSLQADLTRLDLVGFSQGAALAYTFALCYPERVRSIVGLAGFMPEGAEAHVISNPLKGVPAFVAHGIEDIIVPVHLARQATLILEKAGATVTYCEDNVGHRLGASCNRTLRAFYQDLIIK